MRYAVLILALLGGALCTTLAWYWKTQFDTPEGQLNLVLAEAVAHDSGAPERVRTEAAEYAKRPLAIDVLAAAAPLAVLAGLLAAFRKGLFAGPLLAVAGVGPIVIIPMLAIVSGILLLASVMAFFVRPARRKKEEAEEPAPRGKKIEREDEEGIVEPKRSAAIQPAEPASPPPVPMARIGCPKCKTSLKIPNPQAGKLLKCPKCGAGFKMPEKAVELARAAAEREAEKLAAERAAAAASAAEEEPEEPKPPKPAPKKRKQKAESMAPALVGSLLLIACSVAASGWIVLGMQSLGKGDLVGKRDKRDRPDRKEPKDPEPEPEEKFPDDPAPDPAEEARLAAQREKDLGALQASEKQILDAMHKAQEARGEQGPDLLTFTGHKAELKAVAWAPDGRRIASADASTILLWDTSGKAGPPLTGLTGKVSRLAFSPNGAMLAAESDDFTLHLWDATTGMHEKTISPGGTLYAFAWLPDSKSLILLAGERARGDLQIWDVSGNKVQREVASWSSPTIAFALSPDGKTVAARSSLGGRNDIALWDVETGKKKRLIKEANDFGKLVFSPDSKTLFSSTRKLQMFEVRTGKLLRTSEGETDGFDPLVLSPDGKWLASNAAENLAGKVSVRMWDASTGKSRNPIKAHNNHLWTLAFSPGGSLLATASWDRTVKLWDVAELLNPKPLTTSPETIEAVKKIAELQGSREQGYTVFPSAQITDADLANIAKLPRLIHLSLVDQRKITDAGLAHLKNAKALQILMLGRSSLSSASLASLSGLKQLKTLDLKGMKLGDKGLEPIKELTGLTELNLEKCELTDAGLAPLKPLTQLEILNLAENENLTDAGFAQLASLTNLQKLMLTDVNVKDTGLAHLKGMTNLTKLALSGEGITDAGFAQLAGLTALSELTVKEMPNLKGPFLQHLKGMTGLTFLHLTDTGVTDEGMQHISGLSQIKYLYLPERITDKGLAHVAPLTGLVTLEFGPSGATDMGLVHLKGMKALHRLNLEQTKVGDSGLAHLAGLKTLAEIKLNGTKVSDAGLVHLKELKALTIVDLRQTEIGDAGLAHLKGLSSLNYLYLAKTKITDAGLKTVAEIPNLGHLDVSGTKVTEKGIAELKAARPKLDVDN